MARNIILSLGFDIGLTFKPGEKDDFEKYPLFKITLSVVKHFSRFSLNFALM